MTNTNTSTEVTDDQITALRTAAARAGDHSQVLLCDRALGAVDSDEGLDHLRIWTFVGEAGDAAPDRGARAPGLAPDLV